MGRTQEDDHMTSQTMTSQTTAQQPEIQTLCEQALAAGAVDPMSVRFRVVEYDKFDGTLLSVPFDDLGFPEALEQTADLLRTRIDSHFCLQPLGYIQ
jgi:hypothetical protein